MFIDNFHYSILGVNTASRIVFIHGLMAFSANWRKIASKLESQFQCLIYDQRGHGRSFKPLHGYTPEIFAEDLYKITEDLGWDKFHLVGHSMGGRNAMVFTDLYPQKVKTLTLEDIGPEADANAYLYYQKMLEAIPTPFISREQIKEFFSNQFAKNFSAKESLSVLSLFFQANLEEKEKGKWDWKFSKEAIISSVKEAHQKDRWLEVSKFKVPVLLVRGENSHLLKLETFKKMVNCNSHIKGVQIAGAGHWVHYEKYEEFTSVLLDFLKLHDA